MIYSTLDLEADMQTQKFQKDAYDIVVASLVIHATKNPEQTLRRNRYLLKPGGYLIACEVTNADVIRVNSLFGCLPGWWQGIEEGRTLSAAAVDDWVEFIREPLLASPAFLVGKCVIKKLFIVGGATFQVSRLIETVQKLIRPFCGDIVRVQSLEGLGQAGFSVNSTLLVLEDLDHPVFRNMTAGRFESLKSMFGSEKTIVWVTQNRRTDNPFASMPVGFARSALWEVLELRCQFIDFEDSPKIDARVLVESILRFQVTSSPPEQSQRNVLWSVESEIIVTSDGRQQVQRMEPIQDANDRYNSAHRAVIKRVNSAKCAVSLSNTNAGYIVNEMSTPRPRSSIKAKDTVPLHVQYSTL
ncbi:hypothetical protein J3459_018495 [Metarhizium acridum]|nr:hypothetical protein J3459_018495 [Metarhizium acridum]